MTLLDLLGDWETEAPSPAPVRPRALEFGPLGACVLCGHARPLHGPWGSAPVPCTSEGCRCARLAGAIS